MVLRVKKAFRIAMNKAAEGTGDLIRLKLADEITSNGNFNQVSNFDFSIL